MDLSELSQILLLVYVIVQGAAFIICSFAALCIKPDKQLPNVPFGASIVRWFKMSWKMRAIYVSFGVHVFDYITDLIVIGNWYELEEGDNDVEHVDTQLMASVSVIILLVYKVISTIAIYLVTHSVLRAVLQFLDLLLIEEIYVSQRNILKRFNQSGGGGDVESGNINGDSSSNQTSAIQAVESTMRFKYIRSLEALFESTPQAVLQLVFIMRTSQFGIGILIVSICQSILSLTNSMVLSDNAYMAREKYYKYKKKCLPTPQFLSHFFIRLCEITSRVGLFSIFWTVVGGLGFGVFLVFESILPVSAIVGTWNKERKTFDWQESFLALQLGIALPPEWNQSTPTFRGGVSLLEWFFIIGFHFYEKFLTNDQDTNYLLSPDHCLIFFIISLILFSVFLYGFHYLMPDLRLPADIPIRSKWGYAFLGDITELERLYNVQQANSNNSELLKNIWADEPYNDLENLIALTDTDEIREVANEGAINAIRNGLRKFHKNGYYSTHLSQLTFDELKEIDFINRDIVQTFDAWKRIHSKIQNNSEFPHFLPILLALANKQYEMVAWLEKKGASYHKKMLDDEDDYTVARKYLDMTISHGHANNVIVRTFTHDEKTQIYEW